MLAYLDAGSGAALATVLASGAVGASALLGSTRRRVAKKLGLGRKDVAAAVQAERDGEVPADQPVRR